MNKFIVIIRPDFLLFCQDACRAAAFNHLLFRIAGKSKDAPQEKIISGDILWYAKNEQIVEEMSNAWGLCKVRQEVNALIGMGLIGRKNNPAWGADRTKHFCFGEKECRKFLEYCEMHQLCVVHLELPNEVKHLIYSSNANDKSIKCICLNHQMETIDVSDANDESIEAIPIDRHTEDRHTEDKEEGVGSGEPTAPANLYHFTAEKKKRETEPRIKAVKIGEVHVTTDHSTDSTLLPGEHHSDTVSEDICKTRQDDGASSTGHAQEAESELNTPSSLDTLAPAQRSESLSPNAAVQGADKRKGKLDKPAIEPEVMAVIERWSQAMKKTYPMTDTLIKAATLLAPCQPSVEDLQKVRAFCFTSNPKWFRDERKGAVTLMDIAKNWEGWQSSLETNAPTPITNKAAPSNGINHERNQRYSEELRKRFEENGPRLKGLKLRHG